MPNFTNEQLQDMIDRHVEQVRGGAIIGMALSAISGAVVGFLLNNVLRLAGWL